MTSQRPSHPWRRPRRGPCGRTSSAQAPSPYRFPSSACSHPRWLWPWWHPIQHDLSQGPDMIGQFRRHRGRTQPPHLGRARAMGGNRCGDRLPQAGMGQHEVVVDLAQRQVLAQPVCALTRRGTAPSHRRHALPQAQIEPFHKRRLDLPAAGGQDLIHRRLRAEDDAVFDRHAIRRRRTVLTTWA
jgi:hypothetical protein